MRMDCDWCGNCGKCKEVSNYITRINREADKVKSKIVVYAFEEFYIKEKKMYITFQLEAKNDRCFYGKVTLPYEKVEALSKNDLVTIVKEFIKMGIKEV